MTKPNLKLVSNVVQLETVSRFDAAWSLLPSSMKTRSLGRGKLRPLWDRHAVKAGGQERLLGALREYLSKDKMLPKSGGPGLQVWLNEERWDHWLEGENSIVSEALTVDGEKRSRFPLEAVRSAVEQSLGLPFVLSYLDQCSVSEGENGPVLIVRSPTAASRLKEKARQLKECGLYGMRVEK